MPRIIVPSGESLSRWKGSAGAPAIGSRSSAIRRKSRSARAEVREIPGDVVIRSGYFTHLNALLFRSFNDLESALGFEKGRLSKGYSILVLKEQPLAGEVLIRGMTNASGGRVGLPAQTAAEDQTRPFVDEVAFAERENQWDSLTRLPSELREKGRAWDHFSVLVAGASVPVTGPQRAAKLEPVILHKESASPADQYPPGGGVPQLLLRARKNWVIALRVDSNGRWSLPSSEWPAVDEGFIRSPFAHKAQNIIRKALEAL